MSKERLEEITRKFLDEGYAYNRHSPVPQRFDYDMKWVLEYAKALAEQVDSMARIIKVKNKEMRELSDFLKERNIPLKELSPLITVMNHVQELEKELRDLEKHWEHDTTQLAIKIGQLKKAEQQNKRYREVLNRISITTKEGTTYRWARRALEESE